MTKQTEPQTNPNALAPRKLNPFVLAINRDAEPIDMAALNAEMGLSGPRIPAESLVDTLFTILGAKAYQSSYDPEDHVYFCVCRNDKTGEMFTTSLGGSAVVDVLDSLSAAGVDRPLRVKLSQIESGSGRRYYVLE